MYKIGKMFVLAALFVVSAASAQEGEKTVSCARQAYNACANNAVTAFASKYVWNLGQDAEKITTEGGWKYYMLNGYKYVFVPVVVAGVAYYVWVKVCCQEEEDNDAFSKNVYNS